MARQGRQNADESLALALATGRTLRDAATSVGVSERTAARRWADPSFKRRVTDLRGELVRSAAGRLADGMSDAADVLRKLLAADSENVRLGAARSLLELGVKLRECGDPEEGVASIPHAGGKGTLLSLEALGEVLAPYPAAKIAVGAFLEAKLAEARATQLQANGQSQG